MLCRRKDTCADCETTTVLLTSRRTRPKDESGDDKQTRGVLSLSAVIAPYKCTLLPLDQRIARHEKYLALSGAPRAFTPRGAGGRMAGCAGCGVDGEPRGVFGTCRSADGDGGRWRNRHELYARRPNACGVQPASQRADASFAFRCAADVAHTGGAWIQASLVAPRSPCVNLFHKRGNTCM